MNLKSEATNGLKLNPIKANMNVLHVNDMDILFSYKTPVAAVIDGNAYHTKYKWSRTTSRHITEWYKMGGIARASTRPQEFFDNLIAEVK